jgi:hypothetical protein
MVYLSASIRGCNMKIDPRKPRGGLIKNIILTHRVGYKSTMFFRDFPYHGKNKNLIQLKKPNNVGRKKPNVCTQLPEG